MKPMVWAAAILVAAAPGGPAPLLLQNDLDPALVLPPPPAPDSPQARAELAELHAAQGMRTPAEREAAKAEGDIKDPSFMADAIGPGFDLSRLPATARLFELVRATEKQVVDRGKDEFKRPRPWIVDPGVTPCTVSEPLSSYPSGHAAFAFSMAAVMARLIPGRAAAIFAKASEFRETRITCEQHFRSDLTAGQALGMLIAERLRGKPEFARAFAAAQAELAAAGLASR
jgi:acid phosphatase (class A)